MVCASESSDDELDSDWDLDALNGGSSSEGSADGRVRSGSPAPRGVRSARAVGRRMIAGTPADRQCPVASGCEHEASRATDTTKVGGFGKPMRAPRCRSASGLAAGDSAAGQPAVGEPSDESDGSDTDFEGGSDGSGAGAGMQRLGCSVQECL